MTGECITNGINEVAKRISILDNKVKDLDHSSNEYVKLKKNNIIEYARDVGHQEQSKFMPHSHTENRSISHKWYQ